MQTAAPEGAPILIPDRLPSLVALAGCWVPPAVLGWVAAGRRQGLTGPGRPARATLASATLILAWSAG